MSLDLYLGMDIDVGTDEPYYVELWWRNITHNLTKMWSLAGVYDALYMSDGKEAHEVIEVVRKGLVEMKGHPARYKELNPPNGWGYYESALQFLSAFETACSQYHKGVIRVSK